MEKIDYLIYGSTGFIGSYLYEKLNSNYKTVSIGRSEKNDININNIKSKNFYVNTLIHSAGIAHIKKHANGFHKEYIKEDLAITSNLIKYIQNYKINKVIYFSSVSVYGKNSGISIAVNSEVVGKSGYGKCKIESEKMLLNWGYKNGVDVLIYRLPLVVGENAKGNLQFASSLIDIGLGIFPKKGGLKSYVSLDYILNTILTSKVSIGIFNLIENDLYFTEIILKFCDISGNRIFLINDKLFSLILLPIRLFNNRIYNKIFLNLTFKKS
ncbi:MAG: hypothetical protein CME61_09510 [Halobacteriovoraceae bacterium]|nr:hypothetical protein [Halobacteriovoraceae bacterium]|tara:strand:+ start:1079 stop:1885 length:807 start_codon:yes stop_codon:yes gene_type:complete